MTIDERGPALREEDDAHLDQAEALLDLTVMDDTYTQLSPSQFKVDADLGLEVVWMWGIVWSFLLAFLFGILRYTHPQLPMIWLYIFLSSLAVSLVLYALTDNYHVFDLASERVLYHRKFLWFEKTFLKVSFADVLAITVRGVHNRDRYGQEWYDYDIVIIGASGQLIRLSDQVRDEFELIEEKARLLAEGISLPYYKSEPELPLTVLFDPDGNEVEITQGIQHIDWWSVGLTVGGMLAVLGLVYLIRLFIVA